MLRTKKVTTRHPNALREVLQWLLAIVASLAMVLAFAVPANAGGPGTTVITLPTFDIQCVNGEIDMMSTLPITPMSPTPDGKSLAGPAWENALMPSTYQLVWGFYSASYSLSPLPAGWSTEVVGPGEVNLYFTFSCGTPPAVPPTTPPPTTTPPPVAPPTSALPDNASRIAGTNRYATAAAIAAKFGTTNAVVVANGEDAKQGVDALSANYLAGRVGAPILLTQAARVDSSTLSAVKAVLKGSSSPTIYVMGSTDSVSDAVVVQFKTAATSVATGTVVVKRIAGTDRYDTSALAAEVPGSVTNSLSFSSNTAGKTAFLVSGDVNADALAAGPLSYAWGIPVLLTPAKMAQQSTFDAIKKLGITQLIVLGGTDRVSGMVISRLTPAGIVSVKRIAGVDRYATAADLYDFALGALRNDSGDHYGVGGSSVYIANGTTGFPDALTAGPLVGKNGNVLLTTAPTKLGASALSFLEGHSQFTSVVGLGSASTVSNSVLSTTGKAVG